MLGCFNKTIPHFKTLDQLILLIRVFICHQKSKCTRKMRSLGIVYILKFYKILTFSVFFTLYFLII